MAAFPVDLPRQPLAHDQRQRIFQRRFLAARNMREAAMRILVVDLCREVLRHPRHAVRADASMRAISMASNAARAYPPLGNSLYLIFLTPPRHGQWLLTAIAVTATAQQ